MILQKNHVTLVLDKMAESETKSGSTPTEESDDSPLPMVENHGSKPGRDWRMYNVVLLGFSFMLIFTAFTTCSNAPWQRWVRCALSVSE